MKPYIEWFTFVHPQREIAHAFRGNADNSYLKDNALCGRVTKSKYPEHTPTNGSKMWYPCRLCMSKAVKMASRKDMKDYDPNELPSRYLPKIKSLKPKK